MARDRHTQGFEPLSERTSTPAPVDAETVARIAEDKAKIAVAYHVRDCPMVERLDRLEERQERTAREVQMQALTMAEWKGAAQEAAKSAGFRAALYTSLIVVASQAALWAASRWWPVAHAETRTAAAQVARP